jgi:hypothetical protein
MAIAPNKKPVRTCFGVFESIPKPIILQGLLRIFTQRKYVSAMIKESTMTEEIMVNSIPFLNPSAYNRP